MKYSHLNTDYLYLANIFLIFIVVFGIFGFQLERKTIFFWCLILVNHLLFFINLNSFLEKKMTKSSYYFLLILYLVCICIPTIIHLAIPKFEKF
jgi:hypothetical protein